MQYLFRKVLFIVILVLAFFYIHHHFNFPFFTSSKIIGGKHINADTLLKADEIGRLFPLIASKVGPSVVFIKTTSLKTGTTLFGQVVKYKQESQGSGIVLSRRGYIATNAHVILSSETITVVLSDHRELPARIIGIDTLLDIAVLSIKAPNLIPAPLGDSDSLSPGQWVLAVGNPMGLSNSITFGIISAVGRELSFASEDAQDYIQTDASINPGNSGGPLINLDGDVIGMNSAIISPSGENSGVGFAIPVKSLSFAAESIIKYGKVTRGWLGIEIQAITPLIAEALKLKTPDGALVSFVQPSSPAKAACIKEGDVITGFNGLPIKSIHGFVRMVSAARPGKRAKVDILRNGSSLTIFVTIGLKGTKNVFIQENLKGKDKASKNYKSDKLGITVGERSGNGDKAVVEVRESSWDPSMADAPQPGDTILKINSSDIQTMKNFKKAEKSLHSNDQAVLKLSRQGEDFFTVITIN